MINFDSTSCRWFYNIQRYFSYFNLHYDQPILKIRLGDDKVMNGVKDFFRHIVFWNLFQERTKNLKIQMRNFNTYRGIEELNLKKEHSASFNTLTVIVNVLLNVVISLTNWQNNNNKKKISIFIIKIFILSFTLFSKSTIEQRKYLSNRRVMKTEDSTGFNKKNKKQ